MSRGENLQALLRDPRIWRGSEAAPIAAEPSGFAALDRVLPGGGWPAGALSEVLHARPGVGELGLVLPLLARLTGAGRPVVFIAPPFIPYAPALAAAGVNLDQLRIVQASANEDALWAAEQLLQARAGAVLAWARRLDMQALRRLQLGAETGGGIALLYRDERHAAESSPAALRLRVWREADGPQVEVLKCRGARPQGAIALAGVRSRTHHSRPHLGNRSLRCPTSGIHALASPPPHAAHAGEGVKKLFADMRAEIVFLRPQKELNAPLLSTRAILFPPLHAKHAGEG